MFPCSYHQQNQWSVFGDITSLLLGTSRSSVQTKYSACNSITKSNIRIYCTMYLASSAVKRSKSPKWEAVMTASYPNYRPYLYSRSYALLYRICWFIYRLQVFYAPSVYGLPCLCCSNLLTRNANPGLIGRILFFEQVAEDYLNALFAFPLLHLYVDFVMTAPSLQSLSQTRFAESGATGGQALRSSIVHMKTSFKFNMTVVFLIPANPLVAVVAVVWNIDLRWGQSQFGLRARNFIRWFSKLSSAWLVCREVTHVTQPRRVSWRGLANFKQRYGKSY